MHTTLVLTAALVAGCGAGKGDTAGGSLDEETQALVDEMDAAASGYETWDQTATWTGVVATPGGTHGESVQIWWNTEAYDTVQAQSGGDMPEGALIVKEGYNDDAGSDLKAVTYMWKKDGDWFWVGKAASGTVASAGYGISECADCHAASTNDWVFAETW